MKKILLLILLLLIPVEGHALSSAIQAVVSAGGAAGVAVTFDAATHGPHTTDVTTTMTWSHTCSGENRLLFVSALSTNDNEITGVTYNGVAMTEAYAVNYASSVLFQRAWYLVAPATGAHDIVVTYSASQAGIYPNGVAVSFNGVHQTVPTGTIVTASGNSDTSSVTVSSESGGMVVDATAGWNAMTVVAGQTVAEVGQNAGRKIQASYKAGAASVTMSWTQSSGYWSAGAIPLKAANP